MKSKARQASLRSTKSLAPEEWDWEAVAIQAGYKPAKMAALCGISERHLQRIFKKLVRCTPGHWLRHLQCRRAKELIVRGYSSKAAALELAFATESHFCREFKKVYGVCPQSFAPRTVNHLSLAAWKNGDSDNGVI